MTAEIALMNKEAIALAADSAVTMTTGSIPKIFTSANKIFVLSKYHPVGIMIYGNAIFMGVPWETIIKQYRDKLCKKRYDTLEEYASDFINFLNNETILFPESVQKQYVSQSIMSYFQLINNSIKEKVNSKIDKDEQIDEKETDQIITDIINRHCDFWKNAESIPDIQDDFRDTLLERYNEIIDEMMKFVFEKLPLSKVHKNQLNKAATISLLKFSKSLVSPFKTGIVIAGFGDKDIFPALISYDLELVVNNKLKYKYGPKQRILYDVRASIIPFAQSEMVAAFMEGVDPKYKTVKDSYISQIFKEYAGIVVRYIDKYSDEEKQELEKKLVDLGEIIIKDLSDKLEAYRYENFTNPVINIVAGLPKDELAKMAESLVNLTSFKRRVTPESETVSGPIDVAIISKGDGFIWVKRKHYFGSDLNPQFRENYYRRCEDNEHIY